jgi:hypothetical protein
MNDVIPWYKSAILKGILVAVSGQVIKAVTDHYHIQSDTLAALGIDPNGLADWIMNILSSAAAAYAVHARVAKPVPPVTLTKAAADAANSAPTIIVPPTLQPFSSPATPAQTKDLPK